MDNEDNWLAIAAGCSLAVLGFCIFGNIIRHCRRSQIKESRSDTDLSSMIEQEDV